ncbi:reverse transcriptase [Corchorus capsularis]|uniref:Reverse transcriptase n=1 Tax=Corchorus capsularis TaxID=210143 RepID=A0A1R3GKQ5_COCAP|nr:reverse transcriptase [Corchorus capsularis]
MAGASLTRMCSRLSIQEEQKEKIIINGEWVEAPEGEVGGAYLIGKLLLQKPATAGDLRAVFQQIWKIKGDLIVREVGERLFVFQFPDVLDRDRVLVSQPWLFHKALLVLRAFDGVQHPDTFTFDTFRFGLLGEGRYLRIRVDMDLQCPLKLESTLSFPDGESEVTFDYEKKPDYCWVCGLIDHQETECVVSVAMKLETGFAIQKYKPDRSNTSFVMGRTSVTPGQRQRRDGRAANRQGSQSVPAKTGASVGSPFRRHVDSMLLNNRRVARALVYEDVSCEIISKMDDRVVAKAPILQGVEEVAQRRNVGSMSPRNSVTTPLKGEMQVGGPSRKGKEVVGAAEKGGDSFIPLGNTSPTESSDSSSSFSSNGIWAAFNRPDHNPIIPGVGPTELGLSKEGIYDVGSIKKLGSNEIDAGLDNIGLGLNGTTVEPTTEGYDPASPFVFGAKAAPIRRVRKWKQAARVSDKYSCDLFCHEPSFKVGTKRFSCVVIRNVNSSGSVLKKSRENDMEVDGDGGSNPDVNEALLAENPGGLALLWKKEECISLLSYSFWHIDVSIGTSDKWRFTGFYGRLETSRRHESWDLLRSLNLQFSLPWLCAGDFNDITNNSEKDGGGLRPVRQMDIFNEVIDECAFRELPVVGPRMTWSRKINGHFIYERLDRSFANVAWWEKFEFSIEKHLISTKSDHLPLLLTISAQPINQRTKKKPFRFEQMWTAHSTFESAINQAWPDGDFNISTKLEKCRIQLEKWNCMVFGNLQRNIAAKKREYEELFIQGTEGDRNTRFFHALASSHRQKKSIQSIQDDGGNFSYDQKAIGVVITRHFKEIFTSSNPTPAAVQEVVQHLECRVSADMRNVLEADFTVEEIKRAVFQMGGSKAPGPDGFSPAFFQKCWSVVGKDVVNFALAFLNSNTPLPDINHTNVVLIPKIDDPKTGKDFRPISLCNVIFRVVSEALANRLKGLSSMIQSASAVGKIQGVSVARSAPKVTHLFFADDSILFLKASRSDCEEVLSVLDRFEAASGQKINIDKSSIMFSANTEFRYIKDRLQKRISGWRSKIFSSAGKAVMIRAVAQAIPVYLMSVFLFPKSFVQELNAMISRFWWGDSSSQRKIHWKHWESLCVSKLDGGLGFRDFESFNLALLAKQGWRILQNPESLCARLLRAKYYPRGNFMQAQLGSNPSFLWRSLVAGKRVIDVGSRYRIGSGELNIWRDKWINKPPTFQPLSKNVANMPDITVSELIDFENWSWRYEEVLDIFTEEDVARIFSIVIPRQQVQDRLIWSAARLGNFTVSSAYHVARKVMGRPELPVEGRTHKWRYIWSANVLPKVQYFVWSVVWNILPNKYNLNLRGMNLGANCDVCGGMEESTLHTFFFCPFALVVWNESCPWVLPFIDQLDSDSDLWVFLFAKATTVGQLQKLFYTIWLLWSNRNRAVFELTCAMPTALVKSVNYFIVVAIRRDRGLERQQRELEWIAPSPGTWKINTDASFSSSTGDAGLGVVIRDYEGKILVSGARILFFVADSLHAEVHAILFGFELALEHGITRCIIESDSLLAIHEINKKETVLWEGGLLIEEIREIASLFDCCSFQFVNREANSVAHSLAVSKLDNVWCGTIPGVVIL